MQPDLKESLNYRLRKFVPNSLVNELKKKRNVKQPINVTPRGNTLSIETQGIKLS
jgi:hypothetical protein